MPYYFLIKSFNYPISARDTGNDLVRACLKIVNTPKQRVFFRHTALNFLAIRQDACENLPCLAKKFLAVGHINNYQTGPKKRYLPTHVLLPTQVCGLPKRSIVMLEQLRTLDKGRLQQYMGHLNPEEMNKIDTALGISVGISPVSLHE